MMASTALTLLLSGIFRVRVKPADL